jgi:hypothetical protein
VLIHRAKTEDKHGGHVGSKVRVSYAVLTGSELDQTAQKIGTICTSRTKGSRALGIYGAHCAV